jgi:hypothetical protein
VIALPILTFLGSMARSMAAASLLALRRHQPGIFISRLHEAISVDISRSA